MVENYAKSHAARFRDLRDVQIFEVLDVLPAIPFFDIRPHLHEGMKRDDAIQQKVDEFDLIMHMIDDNYRNAYVVKSVLGALIKSQFDARHGADSFTLDELYDAAVEMYANQTIPRVSHQPQVKRILRTVRRCIPSLLRYSVASLPALLLEEGNLAPNSD